ncbi:MAC/Perforin domain-containing protein [Babesia caballi]|uniref:MAC/Perforin domain-containing protein n=1 Tax=Babesia caballi TaxID=5871 RepID=A0AAV4M0U3_BABCB|nr:MAC/Perforin domain-containing protein [Babesia caballi]
MRYAVVFKHAVCTLAIFIASCTGRVQKASNLSPRSEAGNGMLTAGSFNDTGRNDVQNKVSDANDSSETPVDVESHHADIAVKPHERLHQYSNLLANGHMYGHYHANDDDDDFVAPYPIKVEVEGPLENSFLQEDTFGRPVTPISFEDEVDEEDEEEEKEEKKGKDLKAKKEDEEDNSKKTNDEDEDEDGKSPSTKPRKVRLASRRKYGPTVKDLLRSTKRKVTRNIKSKAKGALTAMGKKLAQKAMDRLTATSTQDENEDEDEDFNDSTDDTENDDDADSNFDEEDEEGVEDSDDEEFDDDFDVGYGSHRSSRSSGTHQSFHRDFDSEPEYSNPEISKLNPGLAAAMRYLGSGYDIVFGNPLGDPVMMVDPGYRNPVLYLDWTEQFHNHDGANLKEPRGGWIRPEMSCRQSESVDHVNTVDAYKRELSVDAKLSVDTPFYFSFSASTGYKNFLKTMSAKTVKNYIIKTYCLRYVAGVQDFHNIQVQPAFKKDLGLLPKEFDAENCPQEVYRNNDQDEKCEKSVRPWMRFFQKYGTHYTTVIHLGGKVTHQIQMQKSDVASMQKEGFNVDLFIKTQAGLPVSGEAGVSTTRNTEDEKKLQKYNTEKLVIVIGGDTPTDGAEKESMAEWTRSLYRKPMPIKVDLDSIKTLIHNPEKKQVFDVALKYYAEVYGISTDQMYAVLNGQELGVASMIQHGKVVMFEGRTGGSAVCPPKMVIMMGYSLVVTRLSTSYYNESDYSQNIAACPVGREKCIVNNPPANSEVRVWMVCGPAPIPLLMQETSSADKSAAVATCPPDYAIAYGFGISVPHYLQLQPGVDIYACRAGQQSCSHVSPKAGRNSVWIACVEKNAPELNKISNQVASSVSNGCYKATYNYQENLCPAGTKYVTSWSMNMALNPAENIDLIDECSPDWKGCKPEKKWFGEDKKVCTVNYSWVSCFTPVERSKMKTGHQQPLI